MFLTQTVFFLQSLSAVGFMLLYYGGLIHTIQGGCWQCNPLQLIIQMLFMSLLAQKESPWYHKH